MRATISFFLGVFCLVTYAQDSPSVPLQPFALHVRQVEDALDYLGQPLSASEQKLINEAIGLADEALAVSQIERVLDAHVLCSIDINAESRVKVEAGSAKPKLFEDAPRLFLLKVINQAHITAALQVQSPNSGNVYVKSKNDPAPKMELTPH